jgi:hypothetical protein
MGALFLDVAKAFQIRSLERKITAGVPQGSFRSPFLFSIFTADVPTLKQDASSTTASRQTTCNSSQALQYRIHHAETATRS